MTQAVIVEKGRCRGKKVTFEQDKAYTMDAEEIEELAKDLAGDLDSAGLGSRESRNEEDEGSTTEEYIWVSSQATRVGQEEDGDSDEDKENEEVSELEEDKEEDQACAQQDINYEYRLEKMAERLREWNVDNEAF